ncbi:MAG TPA: hypothetical protein VG478_04635 [Acidimicrobiales bacterium]|nr:hypothetical protein [Acidimicrobiales bacterium]
MPRRLRWIVVALALVVSPVAACSGDDDDGDAAPTTTGGFTTAVDTSVATGTTEVSATDAPATTSATTSGATTTTAPATTVPQTVPGAASTDPTCRAAGDFFSSLNALVYPLSTSFLDDPQAAQDFATLETLAAPSFVAASAALEGSWPPDAGQELAAVKSGFLDPFVARQQAAVGALAAAGVTPAEQEELNRRWQALVTSGGTATEVADLQPADLGVAAGLAGKLDAAGAAFLAAQGPLLESGVFFNEVTYPQLEQYLVEACPDVAEVVAANF